VLRALGIPGADFRIGLSAHDLAVISLGRFATNRGEPFLLY